MVLNACCCLYGGGDGCSRPHAIASSWVVMVPAWYVVAVQESWCKVVNKPLESLYHNGSQTRGSRYL
ncbi:hypothetical protein E2C01_026801 [Portunus trituberculatus]|uniref:Uncharacterized protein n=1 Tax=Portunus trituberculatus TaxID=210409 RepID=A0A5B7EGG7_PORTR|nr:hypothetical protein [Portunus trituberculatus]